MVEKDGAGVTNGVERVGIVRRAGEVSELWELLAQVDVRGGVERALEVTGAEDDERDAARERVEAACESPGYGVVVAHHGDVRRAQLEDEAHEARGGTSRAEGAERAHFVRVEENVPGGTAAGVEEEQPRFTAGRKAFGHTGSSE